MVLRLVLVWLVALTVLWAVFAVVVVMRRPSRAALRDVAVFFPLTVRLVWTLARDPTVPRAARWE